LANKAGLGSLYHRAAARFSIDRLQAGCSRVRGCVVPPSGPGRPCEVQVDLEHAWGPADIAALAGLLQRRQLVCGKIYVTGGQCARIYWG
jgi:hypothetical protein